MIHRPLPQHRFPSPDGSSRLGQWVPRALTIGAHSPQEPGHGPCRGMMHSFSGTKFNCDAPGKKSLEVLLFSPWLSTLAEIEDAYHYHVLLAFIVYAPKKRRSPKLNYYSKNWGEILGEKVEGACFFPSLPRCLYEKEMKR